MSGSLALIDQRAAELRQAFDRSFEEIPNVEPPAAENLLAIGIGSTSYALRLREVSGLFVDKRVTWLPSPVPELIGVAGFRGAVLPVYDLAMLMGCPAAVAPRWLVVTVAAAVALAFERFDGYVSTAPDAIVQDLQGGPERHVREFVRTDPVRPIVHLSSVLEMLDGVGGRDSRS